MERGTRRGAEFSVSWKEGRGCWRKWTEWLRMLLRAEAIGCLLVPDPSAAPGGGLWVGQGESHPQPPPACGCKGALWAIPFLAAIWVTTYAEYAAKADYMVPLMGAPQGPGRGGLEVTGAATPERLRGC